ncbi:uncharacterized protein LOC144099492 [Amblyomma americanum]
MGLGGVAVATVVSNACTLQNAPSRRRLECLVASAKCDASRQASLCGGLQPQRHPFRPPDAFARVPRLPRHNRRGHDDYVRSVRGKRHLSKLLIPATGVDTSGGQ